MSSAVSFCGSHHWLTVVAPVFKFRVVSGTCKVKRGEREEGEGGRGEREVINEVKEIRKG